MKKLIEDMNRKELEEELKDLIKWLGEKHIKVFDEYFMKGEKE